ncbi:MFS general substrate transporter [Favolaschia claudopus]|uniref:MFS general substrate transporter n=1 Tax=Favolaschia claudopus TaxID=2862362 RepID=A0AAW0D0T8_9AGAR
MSDDDAVGSQEKSPSPTLLGAQITKSVESQAIEDPLEVPDGGGVAWRSVFGAWLILLAFGSAYSFGVYEDFYAREYLANYSPSSISWIGGVQLSLEFLLCPIVGKLFDDGKFHQLEISGGLIYVVSAFMLSLAKPGQYYQIFLAQGLGMGLGLGLTFIPTLGIVVHHFNRRKGLASGVVFSGASIGSTFFPIMLNQLFPKIGFAQTIRATAAIVPPCLLVGNLLMRTRLPPRQKTSASTMDFRFFFRDIAYLWAIFGFFLSLLGLYFPIVYIQLFGVQHHVQGSLAFYSVAIINLASGVSRIIVNHFSDMYGPFNVQILCSLCTGGMIWAMLGIHDGPSLVIISIIYGAFSGACLSMAFACFASFARGPEEVGARAGLALSLVGIAVLISAPIQGALLTDRFSWIRPAGFSGSMMFAGVICFVITRTIKAKRASTWKV